MDNIAFENLTNLNVPQYVEIKNIVIPIIQRDYAQGRKNESLRRDSFLATIFNALRYGKEVDLDFVYGEIRGSDFIPIDGQQRLTTIYLLYYYIAGRENRFDEFEKLPKLTYRTRFTSKQFFDYLRDNKLEFKDVKQKPSDWISKQLWYFDDYKKDHSVEAVINMLDAIHEKYCELPGNQKYYEALRRIKFSMYPINGGISSDELYVRMNARGKQLSNFENFKAKIEEKSNNHDFSMKSTIWQDEFWELKNGNDESEIPNDKNLYAFIRTILAGLYVKKHADIKNGSEEETEFGNLIGRKNSEYEEKEISYYVYEKYFGWKDAGNINEDIEYIKKRAELFLAENGESCNIINKRRAYLDEKIDLKNFEKYSQPNIVWLIAMLEFCIAYPDADFDDWARIVNNLIDNKQIDGLNEVYSAIKSIYEILDAIKVHNGRILEWLCAVNESDFIKYKGIAVEQFKEEKEKAKLILSDQNYINPIRQLEEIRMLRGNIAFALELSKNDGRNVAVEKLKKYAKICKELFDYIDTESKKTTGRKYLFERALFTVGDYTWSRPFSWSRHLLIKDIYNRDFSYKKLLNNKNKACIFEVLKDIESKYRDGAIIECLKEIIDSFLERNNFESLLAENDNAPWRYLLVKEPVLFQYPTKGILCFYENKNTIYLPKARRCRQNSAYELFSLYFYLNNKKNFGILDKPTVNEYVIHFKQNGIEYRVNEPTLDGDVEFKKKLILNYDNIEMAIDKGVIAKC